ncbi:MAG: class I SAM-dependent methyltransferase [Dehalococcoidia bacterium]|nr:class I SAM-dependent methyltransferase [Dehalococcoidia bacterium]
MPERFRDQRPCPLCSQTTYIALSSPRLAHLWRCAYCDLVSVRRLPEPEELHAVYGEAYFRNSRSEESGYEDYEQDRYCIVKTAKRRLDTLERYTQERGRLLDVGCALGFFADTARHRGWQAEGIDISHHAVEYATEHLGLPARQGILRDAGYAPGSFDAVTMFDVIEHVTDPVAELQLVRTLLKPGGVVMLSTPDVGSLAARLTGPRWMGYKLAEEHLYYFDRKTITLALDHAGFEVLEARPIGKDVSLDFFAKRLRLYAPPIAAGLGWGIEKARLGRASIYANPRDILSVVARVGRC